jgi:integrase
LAELANSIALKDADGTPLHVTPHDFRRMFITDIVNAGFAIHFAAKLVGHNSFESSAYLDRGLSEGRLRRL